MTSNIAQHDDFTLPDDADPLRLQLREVVMRIRPKLVGRVDHYEEAAKPRLPEGYEDASWGIVPEADQIKEYVRDVCRRKAWPLYIHGRPGVGKTSIAALLYASWNMQPVWLRADTLLREIAFANNTEAQQIRKKLKGAKCVFLDDLGVQPPNPQMLVALFDLLEDRKGQPLIITGNHNLQSLSQIYEARIVSRISAGAVLWLDGNDHRRSQGDRLKIGAGK